MTLAAETFTYVADLVRQRSAIQLAPGKEYLVESRLLPIARQAGLTSVDEYVRGLRRVPRPAEHERVVEALTTNETSWFRDVAPFQSLTGHIVPELLASRVAPTLRVWSAACSTGQEAYSILMAVLESAPTVRLQITATDLSEEVLTRGRAGRYSQLEVNRGLPAKHLVQHFTRVGTEWEVSQRLRAMVTFSKHNLLHTPPAGGPFDVVFLRNVLIYFDLATKREVLRKAQSVLKPGGYLLLGGAETTIGIDDSWERVAVGRSSIYRRSERRAA
ncbi:CheR family methyltransferase [Pengzhenrongella sicca]|uniref:protein-glutamate O-methyltransferase n=1 Tax=Pengzhenrongella sicca TaxID=2819238 RepID=A0A8A4ZDA1_9MICO|nr:protein-glutamate O-methyltransferase CheR [Pengzhenrongella sicca]QTE29894.1 protein-glutamate O-methyltransferase CheR [Pengzhenrongella sicca]